MESIDNYKYRNIPVKWIKQYVSKHINWDLQLDYDPQWDAIDEIVRIEIEKMVEAYLEEKDSYLRCLEKWKAQREEEQRKKLKAEWTNKDSLEFNGTTASTKIISVNGGNDIKTECQVCGFVKDFIGGHTAQYNYCPQCGTKIDWNEAIEKYWEEQND